MSPLPAEYGTKAAGDVIEPASGALINTYIAGTGGVTKGQVVYLSADDTVLPATSATHIPIGVAIKSASAGARVPVIVRGRVVVACGGSISRGSAVTNEAASTARVIAQTMPSSYAAADVMLAVNRILGKAENDTTTAGQLLSVLVGVV